MKKKKAAQIKKYSALGITLIFIGGLIALTMIEAFRKTPETADLEPETAEYDFW
ncbi:MAG: hypothetical protein IKZ95_01080 [Lachnospiraceae bacterium]|nr:hypothetical protein [Lachnospiraceae bacterium]